MPALRSLLEVYGALDVAASRSDDPAVAQTIDAFLPGASQNIGWYQQIESFFFREHATAEPNLANALDDIVKEQHRDRGERLTVPQKSRLFYGLSAVIRLSQVAPTLQIPGWTDGARKDDLIVRTLEAVGPPPPIPPNPTEAVAQAESGEHHETAGQAAQQAYTARGELPDDDAQVREDYLTALSLRLPDGKRFYDFRRYAVYRGWLDPLAATVPLCETSTVIVNDIEAVLVDTAMSSPTVTLTNLKSVVNPYNWHQNYPPFFCAMENIPGTARADGWRRVLETVGFCESSPVTLRTPLKYYAGERWGPAQARLDYDLDESCMAVGNRLVTVDRGFINMWADNPANDPNAQGVRIRTRKVVHIDGLLPYAQARVVCLTGYGTASAEFLLGAAARQPGKQPDPEPYAYYNTGINPVPGPSTPPAAGGAVVSAGGGTAPGGGAAGLVTPTADHVATTAVKLWTSSVQKIATSYFSLAGKYTTGGLTSDDVAAYGQAVGDALVTAPMTFVNTALEPRYAVPGPGSTNPDPNLRAQEDTVRALLYGVDVIAKTAADEDKAGTWGVDGWVRTIHDLIDLQVRTYAAIIKYGAADLKELAAGTSGVPLLSEWVTVPDAKDFDRNLTAGTFTRCWLPGQTVDASLIGFQPEYLAAGATKFRVYLKDHRFTGANYCGRVTLTARDSTSSAYHDDLMVTVGL
jgi:hypothetical protein